mmetsp:Transcript_5774/g.9191  ORF Transcript_5774/g.9191 Transcript_5774/m.9191 type:complete len:208 (+) Transcript_5774:926-1549(+)
MTPKHHHKVDMDQEDKDFLKEMGIKLGNNFTEQIEMEDDDDDDDEDVPTNTTAKASATTTSTMQKPAVNSTSSKSNETLLDQVFDNFTKNASANASKHFDIVQFIESQEQAIDTIVKSVNYQNINTWKNQVMSTSQYGEPLLRFTLTVIISFGALLKLTYQSYGMAGLPIFLIKGTKSLEAENNEIKGSIQEVRDQLRQIQEKYHRS